jgi:hypothetical protein
MLSAQKTGLLTAFLGTLPEHVAARLAKAVEVDRLTDGAALPHDVILQGLRPVLRRGEARDRTPTPLRLFCRPFEDLLSSVPRREKQKGRIARASVTPVWLWVSGTLMPKAAQDYTDQIKALLVSSKPEEARARAVAFWNEVSAAMRNALSTEAGRKQARVPLNGDLGVADALEIALLLSVGGDILDLQDKLPKPVPAFTDELLRVARGVYDRFIQTAPDAAPYVAVIVMNRLYRPWEALRLPLLVSRKQQDTLISSTDMGLVGELLFTDLDRLSQGIRNTHHVQFDPEELVGNVASFAELSSAVVKEIAVRRDGKWGQSLLKDRAEVGNVMDTFMERVSKEISGALPMHKSGSFSSVRVPDFSRSPDPERIERALRYAKLVAGCRPFAAAASFAVSLKDAHDEAIDHLRRYNDDVVKELRSAEAPRREIVQQQFALATELTAILFSEQEAELLRRRGRAALAAAA